MSEVRARVSAFDEHRGIGEVTTDTGDRFRFHCTAIADGSRAITVGAPVRFEVVAGRMGRYEATALRPPA